MSTYKFRKNDTGTRLEIEVKDKGSAKDISAASVYTVNIERPSGSTTVNNGTFTTDGTDGKFYYDTASGTFSEVGEYGIMGTITISSNTHRTRRDTFEVEDTIT